MNQADQANEVVLETGKPFTDCMIWDLQTQFYRDKGVDAWIDVPSFTASSPFIGNTYAHICLAFIRDVVAANPAAVDHPFYIMELGAGTGRCAYYTLKRLLELLADAGMEQVDVRYIMCDIAEKNIAFYQSHPCLKPFIDRGIIDFAVFDLEADAVIQLQMANVEVTNQLLVNPLIVLANYVFDTTTHDAFNVTDQQIRPLLVDVTCDSSNIENGKVKSIDKLMVSLRLSEQTSLHYQDETLNEIVELYRTQVASGSNVVMPNGGFKAITHLSRLANHRLLLLSTDKGYHGMAELNKLTPPQLVVHGATAFSLMVNFHALKMYFEKNHGDAYVEDTVDTILITAAMMFGFKLSALTQTRAAIQTYIAGLSPGKYSKLILRAHELTATSDFETILSHLVLSDYDPKYFSAASDRLIELYPTADKTALSFLEQKLPLVIANYYYLPFPDDVMFDIGNYCRVSGKLDDAIQCYQRALLNNASTDITYNIYHHLGLCYQSKQMYADAIASVQQALKFKPDSAECKMLLNQLGCTI